VAVHGLGGDSIKTWTHPKSKAFWLKDFLSLQVPDARIMTFGHNAELRLDSRRRRWLIMLKACWPA
jgi:hypothetical protein